MEDPIEPPAFEVARLFQRLEDWLRLPETEEQIQRLLQENPALMESVWKSVTRLGWLIETGDRDSFALNLGLATGALSREENWKPARALALDPGPEGRRWRGHLRHAKKVLEQLLQDAPAF